MKNAEPALDVRALNVFMAVLEHGGMTPAARALGLTQSAVSQTIARLEGVLNAELLDRRTRPPTPTAVGEALVERATVLLADIDALAEDIRDAGKNARPRLRLGLIDSVAGTIGAPLIRAIRADFREVSVWSGISPMLGRDLAAGRLDLIVSSDPAMVADAKIRRLLREPFIAVLPRKSKIIPEVVDPLRMSELLPLVRYSERSVIGADIETDLARRGPVPPRVFEFDASDGVFSMVGAGLGWAVTTPLCLLHGRMFGPNIVAVPLAGPVRTRDINLIAANALGAGLAARVRTAAAALFQARVDRELPVLAPQVMRHLRIG